MHFLKCGDGGGHGGGIIPVTTGEEDFGGGDAKVIFAEGCREGVAVADGFAVAGEVGLETKEGVAAMECQAEAGPDVVEDEDNAVFITEFSYGLVKAWSWHFLVTKGGVMVRGENDGGDFISVLGKEMFEGVQIIPGKFMNVGGIFRDFASGAGVAPWVDSVVGVLHFKDFFAFGVFPGHLDGPGGHVGTVFAKDGPLSEVDEFGKQLCQFGLMYGGVIKKCTFFFLFCDGFFHYGMFVAEADGSVSTKKIYVLVPIHILVTAALCTLRVVGKGFG